MGNSKKESKERNILTMLIGIVQSFLIILVVTTYVIAFFLRREIPTQFAQISLVIIGNFFGYTSAMANFYYRK